jgi:heme/copper-type cytochrome/quinol oxidase subunit 2
VEKKEEISNLWYLIAVILPFILWGILSLGVMSIIYLAYLKKKDKKKANKIATAFIIAFALTFVIQFILSYLKVLSSRIV